MGGTKKEKKLLRQEIEMLENELKTEPPSVKELAKSQFGKRISFFRYCDFCEKKLLRKKGCPCNTVWYCDKICQKKHWKQHKADHYRALKDKRLRWKVKNNCKRS